MENFFNDTTRLIEPFLGGFMSKHKMDMFVKEPDNIMSQYVVSFDVITSVVAESYIRKVSYINNRTITYWSDGDKVEARCLPTDTYNKEYGLIVCILKKLYGSWTNFENAILTKYAGKAEVYELK